MAVCLPGQQMRTNYNPNLKTSRSRMANLLMALYDSGRTTFTTAEAAELTRLTVPLASSLLHKARKRGLVSQLKRGLFHRNLEPRPNTLEIPTWLRATWPVTPLIFFLTRRPWNSTAW